jgi:putative ABC transport system substrate-binding protein
MLHHVLRRRRSDADPVAEGVVPSLARPGGNLTGVTISTGGEFIGKRLQLLKEFAPAVTSGTRRSANLSLKRGTIVVLRVGGVDRK